MKVTKHPQSPTSVFSPRQAKRLLSVGGILKLSWKMPDERLYKHIWLDMAPWWRALGEAICAQTGAWPNTVIQESKHPWTSAKLEGR